MQLMVADAKKEARERFSRELNAELDRLRAPARGRPAWLVKELKAKADITFSVTSCQKWLGGLQIPRSSHLAVIVEALGLNHQKLMTGDWEPPPGISDPRLVELQRVWEQIPDDAGKQHVLDAARMAARHYLAEPASTKRRAGRRS